MSVSTLIKFALSFLVAAAAIAQDTSIKQVKDTFIIANLPQDLHLRFDPSITLEVVLPQASGRPVSVRAGKQIPVNATVGPPSFGIRGTSVNTTQKYVIATVDPDAPSRQSPTVAQVRHFLAGDFVVGQDLPHHVKQLVNQTAAVSNWVQPAPGAGSSFHRYTFLLFKQPDGFDTQTLVNASTSILGFNISAFAQQVGLGDPVAGTFMLVENDSDRAASS